MGLCPQNDKELYLTRECYKKVLNIIISDLQHKKIGILRAIKIIILIKLLHAIGCY